MMTVEKWFCFQLRTAGYIIGWFGLAVFFLFFGASVAVLATGSYDGAETSYQIAKAVLIISAVIGLFQALCAGCLLYGTYTENHIFLLPWVVSGAITLILDIINIILSLVTLQFGSIIGYLIGFGLFAYSWIAIYSLYLLLREGGTGFRTNA